MPARHRTYWVVRRRYRRLGYLGSIAGGFMAAILIAPGVRSAEWLADGDAMADLIPTLAIFAAAVLLPIILARLLWRIHRRCYFQDMYQINLR
jgi:hypothetical protein